MKKITIYTEVVNGKLTNSNKIIEAYKSFEGKRIEVTIQRAKKKRSNSQNRYYWGVIVPLFQQGIKECFGELWSSEKTHEHLKLNFNFEEKVNFKTSEVTRLYKSTSENSTIEMEEYQEKIRTWMFENMDIVVPLPNEDLLLQF